MDSHKIQCLYTVLKQTSTETNALVYGAIPVCLSSKIVTENDLQESVGNT